MEANNMKAMREAVKLAMSVLCRNEADAPYRAWCEYGNAIEKCKSALAAPARECDRFADEKQADALHAAFIELCNRCDCPMGCDYRKSPRFLLDGNCASILKCFARFALSKATPKEGGEK